MFEFFNKTEKLPRALKKFIQPTEKFTAKTKATFLAVFDATHPTMQPRKSHFTILAKAVITGIALFAIFAGVSVYADTANVPADNALYPLKRLSENVQLALAPASAKPELQATFAARRASEISDLSVRKPTSTIIAKLDNDFDNDVDASISAAVKSDLGDGKLNAFCNNVLSAIATSSIALHNKLSIHPNVLAQFEVECALKSDAASTSVASTTMIPALPNQSSTIIHFRGGGSLNVMFGNQFRNVSRNDNPASMATSSRPLNSFRASIHNEISASTTASVTVVTSSPKDILFGNDGVHI